MALAVIITPSMRKDSSSLGKVRISFLCWTGEHSACGVGQGRQEMRCQTLDGTGTRHVHTVYRGDRFSSDRVSARVSRSPGGRRSL